MIRIGVVNIDVSHPLAFSKILLEGDRARYVAVYNDGFRSDEEVAAFVRKRGLERRCQSVEELAAMVDVGFIQGCNWDKHLSYVGPFLRLGKPVFIDKPMVGCLADARKLEGLMAAGLRVLGSSSLRYAEEIQEFLAVPVAERGEVLNIMGTCGVDEFNYGIHVAEAIGAMAQNPISVRYGGAGERGGKTCESYTAQFAGGVTATYITVTGAWLPCNFLVTTTKNVYNINVDAGRVYRALLERVCAQLESGDEHLSPACEILDSVKLMLAGRLSRERGGAAVRIDEIPEDDPGFDGGRFEREYARSAAPIYLNEPEN